MKLSEIGRQVIVLAQAANKARTAGKFRDDSPLVSADGDTPTGRLRLAEERSLKEFLEAQPPAVVYLLTAIMYLGRGDFGARDLPARFADMSEVFGGPKLAATLMLEKLPLPDYLEQGFNKLARARVDLDKLLALEARKEREALPRGLGEACN